ncbi:MAG: Tyrosine--tRNA ligase [Parcubacteria bacterium OLB19]|nr:MAG: Tyrosine--tRNA ligase [Parcubacteria bacterium OLB19]
MKLSEELQARGFINQTSFENLSVIFDEEKRVVYHGIDPTADSAHAGNFVIWMLLKHLVKAGHTLVFLVGGGTGMIGDPKPDAERVLKDRELVNENVVKIKHQAKNFFGEDNIVFVDNYDWLSEIKLIDFLRDVGKHFTVNELVKKDAISRRMNSEVGISYTEFAYPLLQAYDYLKLFKDKKATLQIGGSDQWGNIISGVDLVRRVEQSTVYAVTAPLIIDKATGKKFGKSEGNAVWLDAKKTSPYNFYQFWLNVSDDSVVDYLKLFTLLSLEEISTLEQEVKNNPSARLAQKTLAKEVTVLVHGEEVVQKIIRATECLFGDVQIGDLSDEEVSILKENAPLIKIKDNILLVDGLVESGLASSKREARTFMEGGAVALNGVKVVEVDYVIKKENDGEVIHLRRGKKNVVVLEVI